MPLGTGLRHFFLWLYQKKQLIVRNSQVVGSYYDCKSYNGGGGGGFLHINIHKCTEDLGWMKTRELKAEL